MKNEYLFLDNEKLIGTWENKNIVPFAYNDGLEITLMCGNSNFINFQVDHEKFETPKSVFLENVEIINNLEENKFQIYCVSDSSGEFHKIEGRMHLINFPPAFVLSLQKYGDRYFEKVDGPEFVGN